MKKIIEFLRKVSWTGMWAVRLECGHEARAQFRSEKEVRCQPCQMR